MSGRRVLALYAALLFGFAGVLCRLFYLASRTDYAARAAAQSTVTLELPARRGGFYDCMGLPLTGLEKTLAGSLLSGAGKIIPACTPAPTPPDRNCCTAAAAGRLHFSWRWTGT